MNRIKHFMILALALAMSLGAWAQTHTVTWDGDALQSVNVSSTGAVNTQTIGGITVTANNGYFQYSPGDGMIAAPYMLTDNGLVFSSTVNILSVEVNTTSTNSTFASSSGAETSHTYTLSPASTQFVLDDPDQWIGITSIVFTLDGVPAPTVTRTSDNNWTFTMPGYNAALNVTYYLQPDLAWTYNSAAMPAEGLTAYRGFELPVIGGIGASMDEDFLTALEGGTVSLRYGSVNGIVTFTNSNDRLTATINGSGLDTVYMVFDGNDDFLYDSAFFAVTILDPDTLTLSAIGNGTVSALLGGDAVWNNETWANLSSTSMEHSFTVGDITLSHTGNDRQGFVRSGSSGEPLFFFVQAGIGSDLTFTSNGAPFTRIDMEMVNEYSSGRNPNIQPLDGWTFDGQHAVWEGNAQSVTMTSCTTSVDQITFTRGNDSIVALDETAGTYLVIPGATVQAVAEARDGNYVSAWSNSAAVTNRLSDTIALTVSESQTLTATFAQNPLLTLASNDSEWGSVELDGVTPGATTYDITIEGGNTYTNVSFPYHTTVFLHEDLEEVWVEGQSPLSVEKVGNNADITINDSYDGTITIFYRYGTEGEADHKFIRCTGVEGLPIMPEGVTYAGYGDYLVLPGTQVKVIATPDSAHYFVNWNEETALNSNTAVEKTLTMGTDDTELTANFEHKPTLTVVCNGNEKGTMELTEVPQKTLLTTITATGTGTYSETTSGVVTVTHDNDDCYYEFGWIWWGNPGSVTVEAMDGYTITRCVFRQADKNPVTVSSAPFKVNFVETHPDEDDYEYVKYLCEGTDPADDMDGVSSIEVYGYCNSCPATHLVNVTDSTYLVDYGTTVTATATAKDGYHMDSWSNGAAVTDLLVNNNTVTVTTDSTIRANFIANPLLTLASNGQGGTVELDGVTPATEGGQTVVTFGPGENSKDGINLTGFYWNGSEIEIFGTVTSTIGNITSIRVNGWEAMISGAGWSYGPTWTGNAASVSGYGSVTELNSMVVTVASEGTPAIYPDGIVATETDNTFRVLPGTEVKVTATPDSAHYFVNWNEETALNSNTAVEKTLTMGTDDTELTANFAQKPTLTLAHNDGGEMEIVPAGGVTAIVPPTDQINLWEDNYGGILAENDMPATLGFVAVDQAAAEAWTGAPASGEAMLIYDIDEEDFYYLLFRDGSLAGNNDATFTPGGFYAMASVGVLYITTGATPSNVTATAEPNTYYIDYGTSVTVKATPSDTTYLVRFDQDADTNSNVAVEKTYGPLTANVTARATFNDKPVLTLAANDTTWGKVMLEGAASGSSNGYTIKFSANGNTIVKENVTLPKTYQCEYGSPSEFDNIIRELYGWTGVHGNENAIPTVTGTDAITPGINSDDYPKFTINSAFQGTATVTIGYTNSSWVSDNWPIEISFVPALPAGVAQLDSVTYRVDYGTEVTVNAEATALHHVAGWQDEADNAYPAAAITYDNYAITEPSNLFPALSTLTLTVTADTTTEVLFGINSYDVAATAQLDSRAEIGTGLAMGRIDAVYADIDGNPQSAGPDDTLTYTAQGGSSSSLNADANYGYLFAGWYDANADTLMSDLPALNLTEAYVVEARFVPDTFTVSATPSIAGSATLSGTGRVAYRESTTLAATPAAGYHFTEWTDAAATALGTSATLTVQALGDSSLVAVMDTNEYNVSYTVQTDDREVIGTGLAMGTVVLAGRHMHFLNDVLTATPEYGYTFAGWANQAGTVVSTENPLTLSPVSDTALQATFTVNSYTVSSALNIATGAELTGAASYPYRTNVTLEATPATGYHFVQWVDAANAVLGTNSTFTFQLVSDSTVNAVVDTNVYDVVANVNIEGLGTVTGAGEVKHFLSTTLVATANVKYHFVKWINAAGDSVSANTTIEVFPVGDTTLTAVFDTNIYATVWSGETDTTYTSLPYTGLTATYTDFWGNEHTPVLTFVCGSQTVVTPNYPVTAGTWTVTATPEVGDSLTSPVTTLTINRAIVNITGATVETAKFYDENTDAVVTNAGTLNNVQGSDAVTHTTTASYSDATVGDGKTITVNYTLHGTSALLANYNLMPASEVYSTNGAIIEPMEPRPDEEFEESDTTEVDNGFEVYAYGYCTGTSYRINYQLRYGYPDQYKLDFTDSRFTDVDWTNLPTAGRNGHIDIDMPVDLPTGDYTVTVTFRDSRYTWLESTPLTVTFHVNLPETYTRPLFKNVIALVDTCHCFTDIQWYYRADATQEWAAIPGATGYYYHANADQLDGQFFVKAKMNGVETFTCPQTDVETLITDEDGDISMDVFPNPTTDRVTVTVNGSQQTTHTLRILNTLGVELENGTFEGDITTIDFSRYQRGSYMVSVDGTVVRVIRN